jgi:hypothetical protein
MSVFERKQAAMGVLIDAWETFQGKKYDNLEYAEYRRYVLGILSRSSLVRVRLEKEKPVDMFKPFADLKLDELFKPIDF